jgi:hypothetical protein
MQFYLKFLKISMIAEPMKTTAVFVRLRIPPLVSILIDLNPSVLPNALRLKSAFFLRSIIHHCQLRIM